MSADDLSKVFQADETVRRWTAESENASGRLELAKIRRNMAVLLSRGDPFMKHGIDREMMRRVFRFIGHGDVGRLERELDEYLGGKTA